VLQRGDDADPAPIPALWVLAIKGVGFALAIIALVLTLRGGKRPEMAAKT
jgi:hypothetical protein